MLMLVKIIVMKQNLTVGNKKCSISIGFYEIIFFRQNNETEEEVITDNLVFDSQTEVSQVSLVTSSVTNTNNALSEDREEVEDMLDDGDDDFEIINSDDLH